MKAVEALRLGATSYVIPGDIVTNVHYLEGRVQDVELIFFVVDDGVNNLPSVGQVSELATLLEAHGASCTIHLPLDLCLDEEEQRQRASLETARRVIECVRGLNPWAYVLHVDGAAVRYGASPARWQQWLSQSVAALSKMGGWAGGIEKLAVENLEGYPLDFYEPLPYLRRALPRTRVVHLHGVAERDHHSLACVAPTALRAVVGELVRGGYRGVVTIEVFSEDDFLTSLEALASLDVA